MDLPEIMEFFSRIPWLVRAVLDLLSIFLRFSYKNQSD